MLQSKTLAHSIGMCNMTNTMPRINIDKLHEKLTPAQFNLAKQVISIRKGEVKLRSTRSKSSGSGDYIWRMVAFFVSPIRAHQSIPVMAENYIQDSEVMHRPEMYRVHEGTCLHWDENTWNMMHLAAKRSAYIHAELNPIVDAIVDSVNPNDWNGVKNWAKAFAR